ncbi:MAG: bifunctional DNA primase/polymerase [Deltaproteobacteria bacterium]|nr:bifunctional DNA primase/polymerase [Deltaproteobacteria bacterium]
MTAALSFALDCARRGWHVLPVRGKVPATARGEHDASTDPETLRSWFGPQSPFGVAIATGKSGLVVVDVDPGGEGWLAAAPAEPRATHVRSTPRGGFHLYFTAPPGQCVQSSAGVLATGVDVRAGTGYVVAHGPGYSVLDDRDPVPLPAWLTERLTRPARPAPTAASESGTIPKGSRNARLTSIAGALRRQGLEAGAIVDALHAANRQCEPPLGDAELAAIGRSVSRYTPQPVEGTPADDGPPAWLMDDGPRESLEATAPWAETARPSGPESVTAGSDSAGFVAFDSIAPEPIDWYWRGFVARGCVTLAEGSWRIGKTTAIVDAIGRRSRGECLPGEPRPRPPGRAIVVSEDGIGRVTGPRLRACGAAPGSVLVWDRQRHGQFRIPESLPALARAIREHDAEVVLLDPLRDLFGDGLDPIKDRDAGIVMGALSELAEATNVAVVGVNHQTKAVGARAAVRGGGASRLLSAARGQVAVYVDPDGDPQRDRLLVCINQSHSGGRDPIRFALATRTVAIGGVTLKDDEGEPVRYPVPIWGESVPGLTADQILSRLDNANAAEERVTKETACERARAILQEQGRPTKLHFGAGIGSILVAHAVPSEVFYATFGASKRTIFRWGGEHALGIRSARGGIGSGQYYKFPDAEDPCSATRTKQECQPSGTAGGTPAGTADPRGNKREVISMDLDRARARGADELDDAEVGLPWGLRSPGGVQ